MNAQNSSTLSRRSFARATVAGAAVVGFQLGTGRLVAAGREPATHHSSDPFAALPPLDGTLLLDDATRRAYAQDFGQIVSERPAAVLRPGSVADISRMLRFARRHGIRVVGRGRAHPTYGQSQHRAAIVFDLTTFDHLGPIRDGRITIGAGSRWRAVLERTLTTG